MDHERLGTASTYLNNLLLARGLLRDSEPIDFVKPSKETRAQIINLVHDLVLREDRDRSQREHVAITIRTLRAEETRKNHEIERLVAKNEETARTLVQAQAAERTTKLELKKVESAMKSLQDQSAKLKTTLAQVKTQCTNDVRKRDLELARLKTHLQGQQRGNKTSMTAPSITISGGISGARKPAFDQSTHDLGDPEYSLKQETTEFLTQLSQSLSDENDSLITLVRGALSTMRELLGLPTNYQHPDSAIGSTDGNENGKQDANMLHTLPTSYEALAADMDGTLARLKTILTNPNFVSMEEVEVRDEEIRNLREGWERMEQRWRDILTMMEGWRRKMDTGHTINVDDLRRGMGLCSPEHLKNGTRDKDPDSSFVHEDVSEIKLPGAEQDSSLIVDEPARPSTGRLSSPKRKRDILEPPEFFDLRPSSQKAAPLSPEADLGAELDNEFDEPDDREDSFPRMTVAEKLDAARVEAEDAAKSKTTTFKSKPPRSTNGDVKAAAPLGLDGAADAEQDDTLGTMNPVVKKTKIRGRPKRRKSTLSPEELEELMKSTEE